MFEIWNKKKRDFTPIIEMKQNLQVVSEKTIHFWNGCRIKKIWFLGKRFICMDSLWSDISYDAKIIHGWMSTVHFCKGYENKVAQLAFKCERLVLWTCWSLQNSLQDVSYLFLSEQCSPKHELFLDFLVSYESWIHKLSIHLNLFPQNHIFFIWQPFQKGIVFFWDTR